MVVMKFQDMFVVLDNLNQNLSLDSKDNITNYDVIYFLGENDTGDVEQS